MARYYELIGQTAVPMESDDVLAWAKAFESMNRRVKETFVEGVRISTVFLGLDRNFGHSNRPILFETMVFYPDDWHSTGDNLDGDMTRCSTWDEAEKMHEDMVDRVMQRLNVTSRIDLPSETV